MMFPRFVHAPPPIRGVFRTDDEARAVYAESAGILQLVPRAVAVPRDADDVVLLVRWAAAEHVPLVARGSGSSMAGGALGSGVIVDLSRLDHLSAVDTTRATVWAGPGVLRRTVEHAANAVGLRFPVDPSSGTFATIGGMTATNAAGPRTLAFGAMRRWVQALDVVLADGSRVTLRRGEGLPGAGGGRWTSEATDIRAACQALPPSRVRKESSGYGVHDFGTSGDLIDLMVGSEGTLAMFVGVELALTPVPAGTATLLTAWPSLEEAVAGAAVVRSMGAVACELLDRTFLEVARAGATLPVPNDTEVVLLVELEGSDAGERARQLARECERGGATSVLVGLDAESEDALWAFRHAASPILSRLDPSLKSMQVVEDGCVPPDQLANYVRGVRLALDHQRLRGVVFGHAGDAHVHVNALVDVRDEGWRERVAALFEEVAELTAGLGGTMAGEHGDGRLRTWAMGRTWSEEARHVFSRIKNALDPGAIFNPGVVVPGQPFDPFAHIKWDPERPALPAGARDALDRVERERAYDDFRLRLLPPTEPP